MTPERAREWLLMAGMIIVVILLVCALSGCVAQQDSFVRNVNAKASCGDNCEVECSADKQAAKQEIRK